MEKIKNIPSLRFPEFNCIWEMKYGDSVFLAISNKNHNSDLPILAISQEYGAVPREMINYQISVTDRSVESYKIVEIGDFIISLRSFQGGIEYSNYLGICSPAYIILRPTIEINNRFFKYFFKTDYYISLLCKKLEGIRDGKMISYKYFSEILLPFPNIKEQTKIASFLTAVDDKLQALKQKKTLLEQYKRGVMQKIFSQELRFKDDNGNDYPDWEEKKLSDIGKFISGTGFTDKEQGGLKGIPFLKVSDMNLPENKIVIKTSNNFVSEEQVKRMKYNVIKTESLIFAKVGAAIFLERKRIAKNYLIDNNMMAFIPSGNVLFFYHLFNNIRLSKYAQVGALPSYNSSDLGIIKTSIPSITEQTKIANFLSAIDDKINHCQEQIGKTEVWKKGLLQNMFV